MHRISVLLFALAFGWPSVLHAQAKDAFVNALVDVINATEGTFGDEGPRIRAAIDGMAAGLAQWDAAIARAEAGLSAEIGAAAPAVAARMRTALGTIYLERGRRDAALAQFALAAELDPGFADVHLLRSAAFTGAGRTDEAAGASRAAWERDQGNPAAAYLFLRTLKNAESAGGQAAARALSAAVDERAASDSSSPIRLLVVALLDDASVSDPLFPTAAYAPAVDLLEEARFDEAVARYRTAAALDSLVTDPALRDEGVLRAAAARRKEDASAAISELTAAAARAPGSSEIHRLLGGAHWAAKQYDQSLDQLRMAVRLDPSNERAWLAIADVLAASGDLPRAREAVADTLKAVPGSAQALWKLGRLHQTLGDGRNALRSFMAAAERRPYAGAGRLLAAAGSLQHTVLDLDAAATTYERRVTINPNDSGAHADLGDVYRAQDRSAESIREFMMAALLDPEGGRAFASIGQMHVAAGRDADAVPALRKAVALAPSNLEARYALGRALLRLGSTEEGQHHLRVFGELQSKAMDEERRRFRENQGKIEETLKSTPEPGPVR